MVRIQIYLEGDGGGAQSCPTLCGPMDCSPPGFSIHGISQQEYWNGLPFPTPGGHPNQGIEPTFLASPAFADRVFTTEPSRKPHIWKIESIKSTMWVVRHRTLDDPEAFELRVLEGWSYIHLTDKTNLWNKQVLVGLVSGVPFCTCYHLMVSPDGDELTSWQSEVHIWKLGRDPVCAGGWESVELLF